MVGTLRVEKKLKITEYLRFHLTDLSFKIFINEYLPLECDSTSPTAYNAILEPS